jgi:hypothetical protein
MPSPTRRIFVSYSHEDQALAEKVFEHLRGLNQSFAVNLWIDDDQIRLGDQWKGEIDEALAAADLAVLLISPAFLASSFIRDQEQARLLKRRDETGLPLLPVLLRPCRWPAWLAATQIWPRRDRSLVELQAEGPAQVDRALKDVVEAIANLLEPATGSDAAPRPDQTPRAGPSMEQDRGTMLLATTLLADASPERRPALAVKLVEGIRALTGLAGDGLVDAVRFFIEFHLLRTDDPTSPAKLQESLTPGAGDEPAMALAVRLRQAGRAGDLSTKPINVDSRVFSRSNERAEIWKAYFDAVVAAGLADKGSVQSLAPVGVMTGFLSPQFLVAGLLSRLNDDWRPVLNAYQRSLPRDRRGAFESLQASQWNCWLMWGPSIPVCECAQWFGFVAFQYGFGDENNSIPVIELALENGVPKMLGPIAATLRGERRGAKFARLTGRFRWGPYFLTAHEGDAAPDNQIIDDVVDDAPAAYSAAPAQASIYHDQEGDGLVLQLVQVEKAPLESRMYFSAYHWMMFLVATAAGGPDASATGPSLLHGKPYPPWPEEPTDRRRVRDARLWQDLLPVFVHANIGDPEALRFQKHALLEAAVQLLRQVWERRAELFDPRDVQAGIQFHLVCASDYSGCGCEIRFPSDDSLTRQLRARLEAEGDRTFAERVIVPAVAVDAERAQSLLAGYFSACHLPELVADYYEHVDKLEKPLSRP